MFFPLFRGNVSVEWVAVYPLIGIDAICFFYQYYPNSLLTSQ